MVSTVHHFVAVRLRPLGSLLSVFQKPLSILSTRPEYTAPYFIQASKWSLFIQSAKDPDVGKDWGQEEKGTTEDEMVGWHHRLNRRGFGWTPGVGDGQGGLACCSSWGRRVRYDWVTELKRKSCNISQSREWHPITFAIFYSLESKSQDPPTFNSRR